MIRVNDKDIQTQMAFYAYGFNDSLNPTGLGSQGVYFEYEDLQIYVGIKNDVIDVITNQNTNCFLNLDDNELSIADKLNGDSKFGDGVVRDVYVNQIKISIDTALFRRKIYHELASIYASSFPKFVAKESSLPGALLRLEIPFMLGLDATFIGFIYTVDEEYLVLNKAIVDKATLKDDVWYNIWKVKHNIVPHTLDRAHCAMLFDEVDTYQPDGYADYFNKQADTYKSMGMPRNEDRFIKFSEYLPTASKDITLYEADKVRADHGYDIFVSHNTIIAPGIVNGVNMTNFGVKEARRGYWDLSKGNTFLNVGYENNGIVYGDNFYINTNYQRVLEMKSDIKVPLGFGYSLPQGMTDEKIAKAVDTLVKQKIYKSKEELAEAVFDALYKIIGMDVLKDLKDAIISEVEPHLGFAYLTQISDQEVEPGKTVIYTHPFVLDSFAVHVTEDNLKDFYGKMYTSPETGHVFGYFGNRYYFKSLPKEFREHLYTKIGNITYFHDLLRYNTDKEMAAMVSAIQDAMSKDIDHAKAIEFYGYVNIIKSFFNRSANVYIVDTDKLIDCLDGNRYNKYPFGAQNTYIRI